MDRTRWPRSPTPRPPASYRSSAALWPATSPLVARETAALQRLANRVAITGSPDRRVPGREPTVRGPIKVSYYDHLVAKLGHVEPALADTLAYEALNLDDGKRSVSEIRDVLVGRVAPVTVAAVGAWLDQLQRAGGARWLE